MTKEIIVEISNYYIAGNPTKLICLGLGSCLGIALYEPQAKIGGLAHAMLPRFQEGRNKSNLAKYVDTSIVLMVHEITERGGKKNNIRAKLAGGARMFSAVADVSMLDIGNRNIKAARDTLKKESIRIVAESLGGTCGRTIHFDLKTGKIEVRSTGKVKEVI
jgi:chemotaxis protein CheD